MIFQPNVKLKDSFEVLEPTTQGYIHSTQLLAQTETKQPNSHPAIKPASSLMTCVHYKVARSIECHAMDLPIHFFFLILCIYPTFPHDQNVTQGQLLSRV